MWFFGNGSYRRQKYGASSLEKGLLDLIVGREKFCFYVFSFAGSW
jgi:hypothetical protein